MYVPPLGSPQYPTLPGSALSVTDPHLSVTDTHMSVSDTHLSVTNLSVTEPDIYHTVYVPPLGSPRQRLFKKVTFNNLKCQI